MLVVVKRSYHLQTDLAGIVEVLLRVQPELQFSYLELKQVFKGMLTRVPDLLGGDKRLSPLDTVAGSYADKVTVVC